MYKVIYEFADLQDGNHIYRIGDTYPREGGSTTLERTTELMGKDNKAKRQLIEYIEDEEKEPVAKEKETKKPATKKK